MERNSQKSTNWYKRGSSKVKDMRVKEVSKEPNIIQLVSKIIQGLTMPQVPSTLDSKATSRFPQNTVAVFWDYENFPLPKDIPAPIFFETLFPAGSSERFITKRVYSNPTILKPEIQKTFNDHGFEYVESIES